MTVLRAGDSRYRSSKLAYRLACPKARLTGCSCKAAPDEPNAWHARKNAGQSRRFPRGHRLETTTRILLHPDRCRAIWAGSADRFASWCGSGSLHKAGRELFIEANVTDENEIIRRSSDRETAMVAAMLSATKSATGKTVQARARTTVDREPIRTHRSRVHQLGSGTFVCSQRHQSNQAIIAAAEPDALIEMRIGRRRWLLLAAMCILACKLCEPLGHRRRPYERGGLATFTR